MDDPILSQGRLYEQDEVQLSIPTIRQETILYFPITYGKEDDLGYDLEHQKEQIDKMMDNHKKRVGE